MFAIAKVRLQIYADTTLQVYDFSQELSTGTAVHNMIRFKAIGVNLL